MVMETYLMGASLGREKTDINVKLQHLHQCLDNWNEVGNPSLGMYTVCILYILYVQTNVDCDACAYRSLRFIH